MVKTVLISDWPMELHRQLNGEFGMFLPLEYKKYPLDGKAPKDVKLSEFAGYDVIFALPDPNARYSLSLLKYLKEKTGLILIGAMWQSLENYIYNQDIIFETLFPYMKLFDGFLCHSKAEEALYSRLFGMKCFTPGSSVDIETMGILNRPDREPAIVSCSRFHWNNAYSNLCVAEAFKGELKHYEYQTDNTDVTGVRSMVSCYQKLGHEVAFIPRLAFYKDYLQHLAGMKVAVSLEHRYGCGRFVIDCALAGVPCVCSKTLDPSRLFEEVSVAPFDIDGATAKARKLKDDPYYFNWVVSKAQREVGYYNIAETSKRYVEAVTKIKEKKQ